MISDTIDKQLSSLGDTKKFHLNSYLVYMLLQGKHRLTTLGEVALIEKGKSTIWKCYPKWRIERRWDDFAMGNSSFTRSSREKLLSLKFRIRHRML